MNKTENDILVIENTALPLEIIRSKKRRFTITFKVKSNKIQVLTPYKTSRKLIDHFTNKRKDWLLKTFSDIQSKSIEPKQFTSNETIEFLGEKYKLCIEETSMKKPSCILKNDVMHIQINNLANAQDKRNTIISLLKHWYKNQSLPIFEERLDKWCSLLNLNYNKLSLSNAKTSWGSCNSKRNIRLNWRLIMAPISLIDYIILHEVCHLAHLNHSEKFWSLVESAMPDYRLRKIELRKLERKYVLS